MYNSILLSCSQDTNVPLVPELNFKQQLVICRYLFLVSSTHALV